MQRSLVLFAMVAVVALFAVTSMPASQQASAHHKAYTASTQVSTTVAAHHKAHTASTQVSTTVAAHHKAHTASKGKISVHHTPYSKTYRLIQFIYVWGHDKYYQTVFILHI
jgi:hypothetical protein